MNLPKEYQFATEFKVRDYELDYQGIVNNANYLHYFEHTRHEYCRANGITFAQMHEIGLDPVLRKIEVEYLHPLHADDEFVSALNLERHGPRFVFNQDIYRVDGTPIARALVTVVCIENGQISRGDALAAYFNL